MSPIAVAPHTEGFLEACKNRQDRLSSPNVAQTRATQAWIYMLFGPDMNAFIETEKPVHDSNLNMVRSL